MPFARGLDAGEPLTADDRCRHSCVTIGFRHWRSLKHKSMRRFEELRCNDIARQQSFQSVGTITTEARSSWRDGDSLSGAGNHSFAPTRTILPTNDGCMARKQAVLAAVRPAPYFDCRPFFLLTSLCAFCLLPTGDVEYSLWI